MTNFTYWPYDEVTLSLGASDIEVIVDAPWLSTGLKFDPAHRERIISLVEKFKLQSLEASDLQEVNWFFSSLSTYPLCYILPGTSPAGVDAHAVQDSTLGTLDQKSFLNTALEETGHEPEAATVLKHSLFQGDWKWDAQGAIDFSRTPSGIDPRALFSVARRYHLLSSLENDLTGDLYLQVRATKDNDELFKRASALMVRQNHYVTQRCNSSLEPALARAMSSRPMVEHFMLEEKGHDRILNAALKSIVDDPGAVPVVSESVVLMDMLKFAAERNFLSFAIVVDAFERSSYQESDPLAEVLQEGGLTKAASQINNHKDINDSGEHENLALGFILNMAPVDEAYAVEALRIAETTSNLMNLLSTGVRTQLTSLIP
ncbi:MAG TPA: hypothetical protein VNJ01_08800 [Bacteriovoracaceae bacterium]|nr:hypothetical protein [Bacteriovoracaceae bacterium]